MSQNNESAVLSHCDSKDLSKTQVVHAHPASNDESDASHSACDTTTPFVPAAHTTINSGCHLSSTGIIDISRVSCDYSAIAPQNTKLPTARKMTLAELRSHDKSNQDKATFENKKLKLVYMFISEDEKGARVIDRLLAA
jgi:hypothetical protein